jgi:hypothetical protein
MGRAAVKIAGTIAARLRLSVPRMLALAICIVAASASIAIAQGAGERKTGLQVSGKQKSGTPATTPGTQPAGKLAKPKPLVIPSLKNLLIMIRTTLVALYQANITNNYSVLRDLGAPSFREANSVERLSAAFADLRRRGGDIAPVVLALPTLSQPAAIDQNGMLRLTGAFDTKPNELAFDLVFQAVDGFWKLDGIAVQFRQPVAAKAAETPPNETAQSDSPKKSAKHKSKAAGKSKKQPKN